MLYDDVAIPLGHAWSSPFAKWQGTLAEVPSRDGIGGLPPAPTALHTCASQTHPAGCAAGDTGAALVLEVTD